MEYRHISLTRVYTQSGIIPRHMYVPCNNLTWHLYRKLFPYMPINAYNRLAPLNAGLPPRLSYTAVPVWGICRSFHDGITSDTALHGRTLYAVLNILFELLYLAYTKKRYTAVKLCFQGPPLYNASGIHSGQSVFTGANNRKCRPATQTQP